MIKKSFRLMLLVAFALSSVMFVACNKYDDDIERIDNEIASLQATVQSLKAAVDGGAVISSVSNTAEGVKFTLSNGQSYVVNHGTDGAAGAAGKDGSVVTIGENGNWFIDGEDTGKTAKGQGEPGKSPRINEAGNWEIYNAETKTWEDTKVSATGASTYVVDMGSYYQLNVMEAETKEYTTVNIPKTGAITDIKAVSISGSNKMSDGATVYLNYGKKLSSKRVFNGETYAAGTNLVAGGSALKAFINPISANAALYSFKLVDSKGNAPYVIGTAAPYASEGPLTKAKTPNNGVWNMPVELSADLDFSGNYELDNYAAERSKAAYALTTETWEGTIASAYDIKVTEQKIEFNQPVDNPGVFKLDDVYGNAGESIDLMEAFKDVRWKFNITENGHSEMPVMAKVNGVSKMITDLTPYIKDCYFALADKTAAAQLGVTGIDGASVVATKKGTFYVKAYFLLVDGYCADGNYYNSSVTFAVKVNHVATETTLAPVEWTIDGAVDSDNAYKNNVKYLNIENIKSLLSPTSDNDRIFVKVGSDWTWDGETPLDERTVVVNGLKYGAFAYANPNADDAGGIFDGNEDNWIATIEEGVVIRNNSSKTYATNYAQSQLVRFTFDPAQAFPGEYMTTLEFRLNNNSGDALVTVPVKVIIKAPETNALARVNEFFDGDNAVIYGVADGTNNVVANLFDLYKDFPATKNATSEANYVSFWDDNYNYYNDNGYTLASWLSGANGQISVKPNGNDYGAYNKGDVYVSRLIEVTYKPFNNPHIPYVYDEFNLTVKSEIAEGTLDGSNVNAVIPNSAVGTPVNVSLKNIIAKDVYGVAYKLAPTYKYCEEHKVYDIPNNDAKDSRLQSVTFEAGEGFDKFIEVSSAANQCANDGFSAFTVKRKSGIAITGDVECTVVMKVKDNWGRTTKTNIKVILKK